MIVVKVDKRERSDYLKATITLQHHVKRRAERRVSTKLSHS